MEFAAIYQKFNTLLREHVAPASALISALTAVCVGIIAIYTNVHSLRMMSRQLVQIDAGQYQQFQGAIALAWRTIGEANGKRFEVGQSTSLYYLAANNELQGNVTLNTSSLNLTPPKASTITGERDPVYMEFNLAKSSLCGTEIRKYRITKSGSPRATFSHSLMQSATLVGFYKNDDFLGADMRKARLESIRGLSARFAVADLRGALFVGGQFNGADFEGADLRGAHTERGWIGAGYETAGVEYGYGSGTYSNDEEFSWPSLLDPKVGINEVLSMTNLQQSYEGATYIVDFSKVDFTGADLRGAELQNSNISQAQLNVACADETTKLPDGRKVAKACEFPALYSEKIAALRAPIQRHPLMQSCLVAPFLGSN